MTWEWKEELPLSLGKLRANKRSLSIVLQSVCNTLQGFNAERKLAYGDQYLHMGNGAQAVVEAIGTDCMQKLQRKVLLESINRNHWINANLVFLEDDKEHILRAILKELQIYLVYHTDSGVTTQTVSRKDTKETYGYYFYFPPENKVIVARYGDFLERDLISQEFSGRDCDLEDDHIDTLPSENTSEIPVEPESLGPPPELIPVRRSERPKNAPNRLCLNMEVEDDEVGDLGEPANYRAAMIDPDKVLWQGAMDEEMKSMKYTYKARLVAKGCTQTYGIDYEETFSPVADIRAIRILIAIAAYYDYEIWQMDVKTAFLNGRLDEDIYMEQPEGYVDPKFPNGWENKIPKLRKLKDYLGKCFSVKDLGEAAYILGIKIYRDRSLRLIGLNQSAYIDKILKKFNMQNSKNRVHKARCGVLPQTWSRRYQQNPGKLTDTNLKLQVSVMRPGNAINMYKVADGYSLLSWRSSRLESKKQTNHCRCMRHNLIHACVRSCNGTFGLGSLRRNLE
ncbi:retrotransposon protein, putative, ty1-copia subclass [Tanacetum coccineum]